LAIFLVDEKVLVEAVLLVRALVAHLVVVIVCV